MIQMNLLRKQRHTDLENEHMVAPGWGVGCGEEVVSEFGMDVSTPIYLK